MRIIFLICALFAGQLAFAKQCASNTSEKANVAAMFAKVNPFGTWVGNWDGVPVSAVFQVTTTGKYIGTFTYDGSQYGPHNTTYCDYGGVYTATVMGYEAEVEPVTSKKIIVTSPFNANDRITLIKQ